MLLLDNASRLQCGARLLVPSGTGRKDLTVTVPGRTPVWRRGTTRSLVGQAASALGLTNLFQGQTLLRLWVSWRLVGGVASSGPQIDPTEQAIVGIIYGETGQSFPVGPPDLSNITADTDLLWYEHAGIDSLMKQSFPGLLVRPAAGERYWDIESQRSGPVGEFAVRGVYFCWDVSNDPDEWYAQVSYSALVLEP